MVKEDTSDNSNTSNTSDNSNTSCCSNIKILIKDFALYCADILVITIPIILLDKYFFEWS